MGTPGKVGKFCGSLVHLSINGKCLKRRQKAETLFELLVKTLPCHGCSPLATTISTKVGSPLCKSMVSSNDSALSLAPDQSQVRTQNVNKKIHITILRYRGHTRHIVQIKFGRDPENGSLLLVSLGKDMKMNEYDVEASSISDGLVLKQRCEVEQRCQPTCFLWHPPTQSTETFVVIANKVNERTYKLL